MSIKLYSVSKVVGRRRFIRTIAKDVTWTIEPRSKYVILCHRRSALAAFVNILAGLTMPTEGWVKREGKICPPGGFLRYSSGGTPPELIKLLAPLYRFDADEVIEFVAAALRYEWMIRTPLKHLPAIFKREVNIALTLAIPCDYYFFLGTPMAGRPAFRKFCRQALLNRGKESAMVLGTSSVTAARSLGPDAKAAILYYGNLTLYQRLDDALAVFERLQPEPTLPDEAQDDEEDEDEDSDAIML